MDHARRDFRARLVLLGASNLTRAVSSVIETARLTLGTPLEIIAALGHGRSFGLMSTVFFVRTLPSILDCGLWSALERSCQQRPDLPTFALITDIGNDIMYDQDPNVVASWVEQCIERLQRHQARIGMTMIPIESIRSVRSWQYRIVKAMLFPTRKLTYQKALVHADDLHDRIIELANRRGVPLVELSRSWYSFDPIHIRMKHWSRAWNEIISQALRMPTHPTGARGSLRRWAQLRTTFPEKWWLAGGERGSRQPALRMPDGTTIALF